jgi:hypothetical protein
LPPASSNVQHVLNIQHTGYSKIAKLIKEQNGSKGSSLHVVSVVVDDDDEEEEEMKCVVQNVSGYL